MDGIIVVWNLVLYKGDKLFAIIRLGHMDVG